MKTAIKATAKCILVILAAIISFSCTKEDPLDPYVIKKNSVSIVGKNYSLVSAKYYSGYYPFVDEDCVNLHIELTEGAGITVELAKELLNRRVAIEKSDIFWFFSVGDGQEIWEAFENGDEDLANVNGWFEMTCNENNDECSLIFRIDSASGTHVASGRIISKFERMESL